MDKKIAQIVQDVMGKGEKMAPVKSIKLKVKFHKIAKDAVNRAKGESK
jgi:hypothetical protein